MSGTDAPARITALVALYRESRYDVELPQGGIATLRVGAPAPAAVQSWIGEEAVAFYMTACNPSSMSLTKQENDARLDTLRAELRARNGRWLEGAGHMPGESWREPSLLVAGIDAAEADALARRHGQNGILVVTPGAPATLRLYRPDWRAIAGDGADLEWA